MELQAEYQEGEALTHSLTAGIHGGMDMQSGSLTRSVFSSSKSFNAECGDRTAVVHQQRNHSNSTDSGEKLNVR